MQQRAWWASEGNAPSSSLLLYAIGSLPSTTTLHMQPRALSEFCTHTLRPIRLLHVHALNPRPGLPLTNPFTPKALNPSATGLNPFKPGPPPPQPPTLMTSLLSGCSFISLFRAHEVPQYFHFGGRAPGISSELMSGAYVVAMSYLSASP